MRILVVRPGALGDVLLTLPALEALQRGFPNASIEVMGDLAVLELLLGRSVISAVSAFDRPDLAALFQPEAVLAESVQRHLNQFQFILSYATPPQHAFAQKLARVAHGKTLSFDARPRPEMRIHMSAYLQQPLRELGVAVATEPARLLLTPEDARRAAHWWSEHDLTNRCVVAIHPGSGSAAKNWPAQRFAEVARYLQSERRARILLAGGPADDDAVQKVQHGLHGQDCILLNRFPLPLLAAILARCQAYIGNDSGVSHLAAAVGVPTVSIFGPTDPNVWGPRGPSVQIVRGSAPCAPCSVEERRSCHRRLCLEAVPVDAVVAALDSRALTPDRAGPHRS